MVYGLIIAAGTQRRFESNIPKALVNIDGKVLLDINISNMRSVCDKVFVVCSYDNENYFDDKYDKIVISSGKGSGDAVLKALHALNPVPLVDTCFIQWGDSRNNTSLYQELMLYYNSITKSAERKVIVPCVIEDSPYVQILQDGEELKVLFSKYNDRTTKGYHDLSLFYGDADLILFKLLELSLKLKKDKDLFAKHGNEVEFLDMFNYTNIHGKIFEVQYPSFSFNTVEEFNKLNAY